MASKSIGKLILRTLGILTFCGVSAYALFLAFGYNVDLQHRNIEQTSIMDVAGYRLHESRIFLNEKLVGNSIPVQLKDLVPGMYDLSVRKLGFLPWKRTIEVQTDFVSKVEDVVLVPEKVDSLAQQLTHFPSESRYFYGNKSFFVLSPSNHYLIYVSFLDRGTMKEEEFQLSREDIQDIHLIDDADVFLITYTDNSYGFAQLGSQKITDFVLPKGATTPTYLSSLASIYFVADHKLYRIPVDRLKDFDIQDISTFLVLNNVDEFNLAVDRLYFLSNGLAFHSDLQGKNVQLLDTSHNIEHFRFIPFQYVQGGLFVVRTKDQKRLLYAAHRSSMQLLTPQLKGEVYQDASGRVLFSDESGNIFFYKPLLKKKILVTTLSSDFSLLGMFLDDGHFLFVHDGKVLLADCTFSNVYPLLGYQENARYFIHKGALFFLNDQKLKSLFFLPKD